MFKFSCRNADIIIIKKIQESFEVVITIPEKVQWKVLFVLYQNLMAFGIHNLIQCRISMSYVFVGKISPIDQQIFILYHAGRWVDKKWKTFLFISHEYCTNHELFVTKYVRNIRFGWLIALFRDTIRVDFNYFESWLFSGSFGSGILMSYELLWIFHQKSNSASTGN